MMALSYTFTSASMDTPLISSTPKLTLQEQLRYNIQQQRLSTLYVGFCAFMALWCISIESYSIWARVYGHDLQPKMAFLVLISDIAIVLFIVSETVSDMIVFGFKDYWSSMWNIADFVICVLCMFSLIFDLIHRAFELDDFISISLLIARYTAQGIRVVWLLRNAQKAQEKLEVVDDTQIIMPGYGSA